MAITQTFSELTLTGTNLSNPTSLQFGPDGRLYVSQQNGVIKVYDVTKVGDEWQASNEEVINLVNEIPNHDDEGNLETGVNNRQVTGLVVEGTAENPILYVSSSDPRIGAGGGGNDSGLDTNSGIISRLTLNESDEWQKVDLVIGLPRSEENHSTNGMDIRIETVEVSEGVFEDREIMYVQSGGHDNKGAPSNNFAWTPEYYYSAALLRVDLTQLAQIEANEGLKGGTDYVDEYVYALPTLDDPTRANNSGVTGDGALDSANGTTGAVDFEAADTFGGNDGRNQAKYDEGGPVQVYSPGYRNAYDVVITEAGNIYTFDNGPNNGWGGDVVDDTGSAEVTSETQVATNAPNLNDNTSDNDPDNLHIVQEGTYGGHPNPTRASGEAAGLWSGGGDGLPISTQLTANNGTATLWDDLPEDWDTIIGDSGNANPIEGVYFGPDTNPGPKDESLLFINSSSNGLTEYTASNIGDGGPSVEYLAVASFNGNITFIEVDTDGTAAGSTVTDTASVQVGGTPLDVTALGNSGIPGSAGEGAGTLFIAQIGANEIAILEPGDPPGVDLDADNDGVLDKNDPLQFDPDNGTTTIIEGGESILWDFNPASGNRPADFEYNIGFSGWMIDGNGEINPDVLIDNPSADLLTDLNNTIRGGAPGVIQINAVTDGDAFQGVNTQDDAIQTGFTPSESVETFTIRVPIFNPYSSVGLDQNFGSVGFALGDGTQNNYLKVVAGVGSGVPRLQVYYEENDGGVADITVDGSDLDFNDAATNATGNAIFELYLTVDLSTPNAATAQAFYNYELSPGGGFELAQPKAIGGPIALEGEVLKAVLGQKTIQDEGGNDLASSAVVTLLATSTGPETPFEANFVDLEITSTEKEVAPVATDDEAATLPGQPVVINVAELLINDTDANVGDLLEITGVQNASGGTAVLDDAGTPEDASDDFITFTPAEGFEGVATFDYIVTDSDGLTDTGTVSVNVSDVEILYRVNAGGAEIAATDDGPDWAANTGVGAQTGDGFANNIGNLSTPSAVTLASTGPNAVPGYVPAAVFESERWDPASNPEMEFTFDTPTSGTYTVNLFMADGFAGTAAVGARVFDISIEGQLVEDDLDLIDAVGDQTAGLFSYDVDVTDGTLNILWEHVTENPLINAIEIIGPSAGPSLPEINILGSDQTVSEDGTSVDISIASDVQIPAGQQVDVTFQIASGTATAGEDFEYTGGGTLENGVYTHTLPIAGGSSDLTFGINILDDAIEEGTEAFTVTITGVSANATIGTDSQGVSISDNDIVIEAGDVLYRVNSGGPEIAATDDGPAWGADTGDLGAASNSPYLVSTSSGTSVYTNASGSSYAGDVESAPGVDASVPLSIFDTERYDSGAAAPQLVYQFDVGTDYGLQEGDEVEVRLFFAEIFGGVTAAGERVFDVSVDGAVPTAFDDVDAIAETGTGNIGMVRSYTATVDADGLLDIAFIHDVQNPAVKGIEIVLASGGVADPSVVSIGAPTPATVVEDGDTDFTTLIFPVTFDELPSAYTAVSYDVDINGVVTSSTLALGVLDGQISVNVPNDALNNGTETVTVTLTGIVEGPAVLGTASAIGSVTEDDDGPVPGEIVIAINAGGDAITDAITGIDYSADAFFTTPSTAFGDGNGGNGPQPAFDGSAYETERFGSDFSYAIPVEPGLYDVDLHFAEIFASNPGDRQFDVIIEGQLVLDEYDILAENGGLINETLIESFYDIDPTTDADDANINIQFVLDPGADNAKVNGIVIRNADPSTYEPPRDDLFGLSTEIADTGDAPSGPVLLAEGSNVMSATQEGEGDGENGVRDRDYFTITIPEGYQLSGLVLDNFLNANGTSPDGFLAFQQGSEVTVDPLTGANVGDLQGAIIYGSGETGNDLLGAMRAGFNDPATNTTLPAFDQALTGTWTFWMNQGAGPSTATLDFQITPYPTIEIGNAADVEEGGDVPTDNDTLLFPITATPAVEGDITLNVTIEVKGVSTQQDVVVTLDATGQGTLSVDVPQDDLDNGADTITVTLNSVAGTSGQLGTTTVATGIVTEDDGVPANDIDEDGILNIDDPFAYDGTNGDAKALVPGGEFVQDFETDTTNPFSEEAGFSGILVNQELDPAGASATDPYGDRTDEAKVNISGGTLNITSSNSDAFGNGGTGNNNIIKDNYQSAVDVTGVNSFEVVATAANPWFGATQPGQYAAFGINLGAGGVEDWVKLVFGGSSNTDTSAGMRVELASQGTLSDGNSSITFASAFAGVDPATIKDIEFKFVVDKGAATLDGSVTFFDDEGAEIGTINVPQKAIDPTGALAASMNGQNPLTGGDGGLAYGVSITDFGAAGEFTASWNDLAIRSLDPFDDVPPTAIITPVETVEDTAADIVVEVTYADETELNEGSIDISDVVLTGPGLTEPLAATGFNFDAGVATYTFAAPEGGWTEGDFTATLAADAVTDVTGNGVAEDSTSITVDVPVPDISISIAADQVSVAEAEGATATFTVTLSEVVPAGQTIEVAYTVGDAGDTAAEGTDYIAQSDTLIFTEGEDTLQITVDLINDDITEMAETLSVVLNSATIGSDPLTISTATASTEIELETDSVGSDGDEEVQVQDTDETVDISSGGSDTVSGDPEQFDDLKIIGFDTDDTVEINIENPTTTIVDVREGSTIVGLDTTGDGEEDTTIEFEDLVDPTPNSPLTEDDFTIENDVEGGTTSLFFTPQEIEVSMTIADGQATTLIEEDEDFVQITVSLSETADEDVTVTFDVTGDTSAEDVFIAPPMSVTIPAGELSAPIFLEVLNDTLVETPEALNIAITSTTVGAISATEGGVSFTIESGDTEAPVEGDPIVIEAEDFTGLGDSAYFAQGSAAASNNALIRLNSFEPTTVETELPEDVTPGTYKVQITYFDENDGQSTATAFVGGVEIGSWVFNNDGGGNAANASNLRTIEFTDVIIEDGDTFSLIGERNVEEYVRIDKITLIKTAEPPVNEPPVGDVPDTSVPEGQDVDITFGFTDPESDDITYEATLLGGDPLPDWLILGADGLTGTPPPEAIGTTLTIEVTATDTADNPTIDTFDLILEDNTGPAPTVEVTPPATLGDPIIVSVTFDDASAIDELTVEELDVALTGPVPAAAASSVEFDAETNTATYTFDAPLEGWTPGDYAADFAEGAVSDVAMNTSSAVPSEAFAIVGPTDGKATFTANAGSTAVTSASTFGGGSMVVVNDSTNGVQIDKVVFSLAGTSIPETVFDPDDGSPAGDSANKSFELGTATGVSEPVVTYEDAFDAGFYQMTLDFAGLAETFDPGDSLSFAIDIDPVSAYSPLGGGAVSGQELMGGTFTVFFSDGTTATGTILPDGAGTVGATAIANTANELPAPALALDGEIEPTLVNEAAQTISVDAGIENAGATVRLYILDTAYYVQGGGEGPDLQGNAANAAATIVDAIVGEDGTVEVPVTLTRTDNGSGDDDLNLGINYVSAALLDDAGEPGPVSNGLTIEFDPSAVIGDDDLAPGGDLDGDEIANAVDPDVDGDLIPNVDDAFAYDAENGVLLADGEMIELTFDVDGTPYQNGFTGLLQGTGAGFEEDTGTATVANGALTVVANNGDTGGNNNPSDDFQLGLKNGDFTVEARIDNPFQAGAANFDQIGVHVGVDSADFVKLVFGFAAGQVEFSSQTADTEFKAGGGNQELPVNATLADFAYADMTLVVSSNSPTSATITASISFYDESDNLLAENVPYGTIPVSGALAAALADDTVGVGTGFTQTQFGGADAPFDAVMQNFKVTANEDTPVGDDVLDILGAIETTAEYTGGEVGSAVFSIIPGNNNIQTSNFGNGSFIVENTGDKDIAAVFIDVRGALYTDSVFDPDGQGGDNVAKTWQVNDEGGTGAFIPGSGYFLPGPTPVAGPGNGGFEGVIAQFSDFGNGETATFSGDMDPNSIAGLQKGTVDSGATNGWDVGGVSGAELIGSTVYVLFDDGSISTGQLFGDDSQAGSQALIAEDLPGATATLDVTTAVEGEYGGQPPQVVVTGTPGDTVRVILTKGFDPVTNPEVDALVAQRLEADEFGASNAFDFQTVDIEIPPGGSIDITDQFQYSDTDSGVSFDGDDVQLIAFTAAVIDPSTGLAQGPATDPIRLESNGTPVEDVPQQPDGYYLVADDRLKVQFEDIGTDPGSLWSFFDSADEEGNQSNFQGAGYYEWNDGGYGANGEVLDGTGINTPQGELSYTFFIPDGDEGNYTIRVRTSRDTNDPGDQRNDVWVKIDDNAEDLLVNEANVVSNSGFIKLFGNSTGNFGNSSQIDTVSEEEPNFTGVFELEPGFHTITFAGRSTGFHLDFFELYKGGAPAIGASNSQFIVTGPTIPTVADPIDDAVIELGSTFDFTVPAGTFQDLDMDELDLTAVTPDGVNFDEDTGLFSGAPTAGLGTYDITVTATDDDGNFVSDTFTLEVVEDVSDITLSLVNASTDQVIRTLGPNDVIDPAELAGGDYSLIVEYSGSGTVGSVQFQTPDGDVIKNETFAPYARFGDSNSNPLDYFGEALPSNGTLLDFVVKVFSGPGGSGTELASDDFLLTIGTSTGNNTPPAVENPIADQTIADGEAANIDLSDVFSDADPDDVVTITNVTGLPQGVTLDGTSLVGTPTEFGTFDVTVFATDGEAAVSDMFQLTAEPPADLNLPPIVANPISDQDLADGEAVNIDLSEVFDDPNPEDTVTITNVTGLPLGVTLQGNSLVGTPTQSGEFTVTVFASDGEETVSDQFELNVEAPPPAGDIVLTLVNADTDQLVRVLDPTDEIDPAELAGGDYSLLVTYNGVQIVGSVQFETSGGNVLRTESIAPYARFGDEVGTSDFFGEALPAPGSSLDLVIKVFSGSGGSGTQIASQAYTIDIADDLVGDNARPVVSDPIDDLTIEDGDAINIDLSDVFTDPDPEDTVTITNVTGLPDGVTLQGNALVGTPTQTGEFNITVFASDGEASTFDAFQLTVEPPAPVNGVTLSLVNADTDQVVRVLSTDDVIDPAELSGGEYALLVNYTGSGSPGSVQFETTDGDILKTESIAPYTRFGDQVGGSDIFGEELPPSGSTLDLVVKVFSGSGGSGTELASVTYSIDIDDGAGALAAATSGGPSLASFVALAEDPEPGTSEMEGFDASMSQNEENQLVENVFMTETVDEFVPELSGPPEDDGLI